MASPDPVSPRQMIPLSGINWQFFGAREHETLPPLNSEAYHSAAWTDISVPHVFQTRDNMSLEQGWYRTKVDVPSIWGHSHLYLMFEGAAVITDIYVNGQHLGQHRGAYTRFIFDATSALHPGADNELAVQIDARSTSIADCLPNGNRLYTVWGGLYRHVWLLVTNDLQIDPTYYASPGIFITPGNIVDGAAKLDVKVLLRNTSSITKSAIVKATVLDPENKPVQTLSGQMEVLANQGAPIILSGTVNNLLPWTPETPHLYHVRVDVSNAGELSDTLTEPLGFHTITWNLKDKLFQLDGKPYVLYGVDLHQEIEKKASAVEPQDLIANFDALQDLGVNFVRLSHYPRAQIEYDLCDQRGIFCWSENGHSNGEAPTPTADQITTEMVEQNYNHPSIIVWSVGNEASEDTANQEVPIVKALDSTRPVMVANMKCSQADCTAANTYPGWYGQTRWKFKPHGLITEIGAGGVVATHTDYASEVHKVDTYEPEEYQQLVAEVIFEKAFRENEKKLGMFAWWTFREFNDFKYKSHEAPLKHGINSKGLETYAGDKKDIYYLYRSFLRPAEPTLHITSKRYFLRQGAVDNGIKVYSNAKQITLQLNGETVSTLTNGQYSQTDPTQATTSEKIDNVFYWNVPLHAGKNTVTAVDDKGTSDSATIYFYGSNGLPELPNSNPPIKDLASSNPANPAYYMDMPVEAQWPIYYDLDSTADNSLDLIPNELQGATWLALHRVTKSGEATDVSFALTQPTTVYVMCTKQESPPAFLTDLNFKETDAGPLSWRGKDLILTPAHLFSRHFAPGESIKLSLGNRDALVLFKTD